MTVQRIYKGKSLLANLRDYTVVDIETTGMAGWSARIIEISAVRVRQQQVVAEFSRLIRPHQPLSYFIKNLTGITDAMLAQADELSSVLVDFMDFLGEDVVVLTYQLHTFSESYQTVSETYYNVIEVYQKKQGGVEGDSLNLGTHSSICD